MCRDVCKMSHFLGACKIYLQQARFTFRHRSVLQHLVLVLKSFLKFGAKFSKTNNVSIGILYLASDWIFLADVKGDCVSISIITYGIVLFSKSSK